MRNVPFTSVFAVSLVFLLLFYISLLEKSWNKTLKHIHTQHKKLDESQKKQVAHSR